MVVTYCLASNPDGQFGIPGTLCCTYYTSASSLAAFLDAPDPVC